MVVPVPSPTAAADPTGGARAVLPQFLQRAYCNAGRPFSSSNNNNSKSEALSPVCAADSFACGAPMECDKGEDQEDDDDDDDGEDDIRVNVNKQEQEKQYQSQRGMRSLVDGILSPFINCVQPPLQACTAPAADWQEPSSLSGRTRIRFNVCSDSGGYNSNNRGGILQRKSTDVFSGLSATGSLNQSNCRQKQTNESPTITTRTTPRDNDILCGRGNNSNRHQGNQQFRDLIAANKAIYSTLTKKEKMLMARHIVDLLLNHTDPPGRFLGRDTNTGLWYDIGLPRSIEKTSQALREKTAAVRAAEKQAASTSASANTPPDPSDAESDVFSNISEPVVGEVDICKNSANMAKSRAMAIPSVNIPAHLQHIFGHIHAHNHHPSQPKRQERHPQSLQQTTPGEHHAVDTRSASFEPPHGHRHPYSLQHLNSDSRTVQAARQRSAPFAPTHNYAYDEYPFDERRLATHGYGHHHSYYADPRLAVHIPPPPPAFVAAPFARTPRSMVTTTPPHARTPRQGNMHPIHQQQQFHHFHPQPAAIVTPQHPYSRARTSSLDQQKQSQRNKEESSRQLLRLQRMPQSASTPTRRGGTPRASSDFPEDVFQNPEWSSPPVKSPEHERPAVETKDAAPTQLTNAKGIIHAASPTLEQEWKRQRVSSMRRVDVSSSTTNGGDTSLDTPLMQNLGTRHDFNDTERHNTSITSSSSTGLITEAIETQLTLEERVISSPSALNQSYASRRRRSALEALPRPAKISNDLNLSADSMDGMAALATAAFLRLDETDD